MFLKFTHQLFHIAQVWKGLPRGICLIKPLPFDEVELSPALLFLVKYLFNIENTIMILFFFPVIMH